MACRASWHTTPVGHFCTSISLTIPVQCIVKRPFGALIPAVRPLEHPSAPASGHALPTPPPTRSGEGLGKGEWENAGGRDCTRAEMACTQQTPLRYTYVTDETTCDVVDISQLPPESAVRRHRHATDQSRSEYQRVCGLRLSPAGSLVCGRERAARRWQRWSPLSRYTHP